MQEYFQDKDLAARYGVSRMTIWRWTKQGRLPQPIRISGCCTRWERAPIEALEEMRRKRAAALVPVEEDCI